MRCQAGLLACRRVEPCRALRGVGPHRTGKPSAGISPRRSPGANGTPRRHASIAATRRQANMSLKEIIVSVDYSDTGLERLRFALDIAQVHRAHLTAFYTSPTASPGEGGASENAEAIEAEFEGSLSLRGLE